ncbi:MAG TPA: GNAT family N-acetyltransferase [Flavobacteriales bacterium]|nr:GNAT family N-acetyltransferase [Flavobacteriales bacterium]
MSAKDPLAKIDLEALPLLDETEARAFILKVGTLRARMEYDRSSGDRIFLTHIDVSPALEAHDAAAVLTEKVFQWAEANKLKVVPYCPYVKTYLRRHTAWQRLLVKGVQV